MSGTNKADISDDDDLFGDNEVRRSSFEQGDDEEQLVPNPFYYDQFQPHQQYSVPQLQSGNLQ